MESKPRLVEIPATLAAEFAERSANGDLAVPHVIAKTYCEADQLAAYQAATEHPEIAHDRTKDPERWS